jgi:trigger factor
MKHEVKRLANSAVEISIEIAGEEVKGVKETVLAEVAQKVEVKGFRKGKAPVATVEKEYATLIEQEVTDKLMHKYYPVIMEEEKIEPISFIEDLKTELTGDTFKASFKVDVYPTVELGQYKGLEVEKETFTMTDEMLDNQLNMMVQSKSKLVDAPEGYEAKMGDTVDLAFEGFIDGVPFEGGKSDSHMLKLGSKMFIDNFEDQLVGYKAGQEGEVTVTFPEAYHQESLAGKPATFKVKVNAVKVMEVPTLDDSFAKELGFESVEDMKAKVSEEIVKREEQRVENEFVGKLVQKIAEDTKVEVPNSMVQREIQQRMAEMEQQLSMQGIGFDMYLQMTGMTKEKMAEQIAPIAVNKVKVDLILEAIAKAENIVVTDEELKEQMTKIASMYGMDFETLRENLEKNGNLNNFTNAVKGETLMRQAIDFVVRNAK